MELRPRTRRTKESKNEIPNDFKQPTHEDENSLQDFSEESSLSEEESVDKNDQNGRDEKKRLKENKDKQKEKQKEKQDEKANSICRFPSLRTIVLIFISFIALVIFRKFQSPNNQDKVEEFLDNVKENFVPESLSTIEYVLHYSMKNENKSPYFLTLFGTNETELYRISDQMTEVFGELADKCKIHLNPSSNKENITETISNCVEAYSSSGKEWWSCLRDFFVGNIPNIPNISLRNLHHLSGDTPEVFHRYCDDTDPVYAPALFVATFTTSSPYNARDYESVNEFAENNLKSIFRDLHVDYSTKVINRLLANVAVLSSTL